MSAASGPLPEVNCRIIACPFSNRLASSCAGSCDGLLMVPPSCRLATRRRWCRRNPRSMQLDVRLGAPRDHSCRRVERDLPEPVQRQLVHLVQRQVHHSRKPTLDPKIAPGKAAHEISHDGILAKRNEGTEVAIAPRRQRLSAQAVPDLLHHVRRLLMCGLRARRYLRAFLAEPGTGGAIADREDTLVACRLQGWQHHQLIDAIGLQSPKVFEKIR